VIKSLKVQFDFEWESKYASPQFATGTSASPDNMSNYNQMRNLKKKTQKKTVNFKRKRHTLVDNLP
jgi:hypothetical protein